jgi:tRNA pseudouridine55 synthase
VAVGEATKAVRYIHLSEKTYIAKIRFGLSTDTLDVTGRVTASVPCPPLSRALLEPVLTSFTGEILQVPPAYSALKVGGRRMYDAARAGEDVTAAPRKVVVRSISLAGISSDEAEIEVRCGSGTYVRALARDIGAALGTAAVLSALRRTSYGVFTADDSCAPQDASDGRLVPITRALPPEIGRMEIPPGVETDVRNGREIGNGLFMSAGREPPPPGSRTALTGPGGRLIAVILRTGGSFSIERVFHET